MIKQLYYLVCIFGGCTLSLSGQQVFDFESDSLSGWLQVPPGRWECSSLNAIHGEGSLHHAWDNPAAGVDQIEREMQYPDLSDTLSVAFRVRHGYPPSSGNNWQLFLLSGDPALLEKNTSTHTAMIFGVNFSGNDDHLKLWQMVEGEVIEILDTGLDYQEGIGTNGEPAFRITRYPGGKWDVAWHINGDPEAIQSLGASVEVQPLKGKYMGFRYAYSSSQDRKLWLDDITVQGRFFKDTVPPKVTHLRIRGLNGLEIKYDEPVSAGGQHGYRWNGTEPDSFLLADDMHRIYFADPFSNREDLELHVSGIRDLENNYMRDTVLAFRQDLAAFGDIVINEIMTDPDPAVYLPGCEFVELYNRYQAPLELNGWSLVVNNREFELRGTTMQPGEFLVLTHPDCNGTYGNVAQQSVLTSATALTNGGARISLRDQYGRLVHSLTYEAMERYGAAHIDGGWSLERADPDNLCGGVENWFISVSGKGGTPGMMNSHQCIVPDHSPPRTVAVGIPASHQVDVLFNEPVFITCGGQARFRLGELPALPGTGCATFAGSDLLLELQKPMDSLALYQLILDNVSDCAGNIAENQQLSLMLPVSPDPGMPVISEIMYDPAFGGNEYIELVNTGDNYYDLYDLQLELREPGSVSGTTVPVSEASRLLFPGTYVVLCRHAYALRSEWSIGEDINVLGLDGWRQLPDGGACIRLTDRSGRSLDQVCYHDSMHHDPLQITSGVSLERIDPGCRAGTQCWTSAASSENYGTPGVENSQALVAGATCKTMELIPKVFSPDGDGVDDYLNIYSDNKTGGELVDLYVTDLSGNLIRQIVSSGIPGNGDHFYWNGEDQQGKIVLPGIYVVHQRSIGSAGKKIQREACAVVFR